MRLREHVSVLGVVTVSVASLCAVPELRAQNPEEIAKRQAVEVAARVPLERPVQGAPYSADTVVESSQTLADGNHITNKTTGKVYRDSEGRVRREEERTFSVMTANGPMTSKMVSITILDPVGGAAYTLDTEKQIAWKTPTSAGGTILGKLEASQIEARRKEELDKMQAAGVARGRQGGAGTPASEAEREAVMKRRTGFPTENNAPLEHRTIEGLAVEGRKVTHVIPAGQVGNELPMTVTSEEWSSPELKVLVMTHHSDPRTGDSSYRLTNVIRAEPDPSLFQVPAGYTVKETGISKLEPAARRE
jgi:hypothetical protein